MEIDVDDLSNHFVDKIFSRLLEIYGYYRIKIQELVIHLPLFQKRGSFYFKFFFEKKR